MKALLIGLMVAVTGNVLAASQLDDLIRGEMSAVKTYDTVLADLEDKKERPKLEAIRKDHVEAVEVLKSFASSEVKEDTETSGPWGGFTKAFTGGAKLLGDKTALKALRTGEEHGIKEYEEALKDETVKMELKQKIRARFLPKQKEHIKTLNQYI